MTTLTVIRTSKPHINMERNSRKRSANGGTKRTTAMRRQDENAELTELATALPVGKNSSSVDKISVVRLTTAYLKFRNFLSEAGISWPNVDEVFAKADESQDEPPPPPEKTEVQDGLNIDSLLNSIMDGFLIVISADSTILYVPDYVTEYVGLTQLELIGQTMYDVVHEDDFKAVERNFIYDPSDAGLRQWRQFCVRFRTSLNTPKSPLSKFSGHKMMQMSGFLKCITVSDDNGVKEHPKAIGFIGECKPIESMSIVEMTIERSSFTSTTTLDLKFTAVESRVKMLIGYDPEDLLGSHAYDFFHPSDFKACAPGSERAVKCKLTLLNQGRVVSPIHRFLTKSGDWVWVQMVAVLSYVPGTKSPFDVKVTFRIVSSEVGQLNFVEHTEAYKGDMKQVRDPYRVHFMKNTQFQPQPPHPEKVGVVHTTVLEAPPNAENHQKQALINQAIRHPELSSNIMETIHHTREYALKNLVSGHGVLPAITTGGEEPVSLYPKNFPTKPTTPAVMDSFLEPTVLDDVPYSSPLLPNSSTAGSCNGHSTSSMQPSPKQGRESLSSAVNSPCQSDSSGFCSVGSPDSQGQPLCSPPTSSYDWNVSDASPVHAQEYQPEFTAASVSVISAGIGSARGCMFGMGSRHVFDLDVDRVLQDYVQ